MLLMTVAWAFAQTLVSALVATLSKRAEVNGRGRITLKARRLPEEFPAGCDRCTDAELGSDEKGVVELWLCGVCFAKLNATINARLDRGSE